MDFLKSQRYVVFAGATAALPLGVAALELATLRDWRLVDLPLHGAVQRVIRTAPDGS